VLKDPSPHNNITNLDVRLKDRCKALVMAKCAKPNEYNVWLMPKALTTFPTMVEDHMMTLE
jgi:hypothetical protein